MKRNILGPRIRERRREIGVTQADLARQAEALAGKHGGQLWALSKKDGRVLARYALDSPPVFDGMIVASGRIYAATVDGHLICLSEQGSTTIPTIEDQPVSTDWDQPRTD